MLTVTEVSRQMGVSTRMLRYYEQQGLIRSTRREDYAYRIYDEENVNRLRLLLVLRRLRVPLKDVARILEDGDASGAVEVLRRRMDEVSREIRSLDAVRQLLSVLTERIAGAGSLRQRVALLADESLMSALEPLGFAKSTLKEKTIMSDIRQAEKEQWRSLNVRYVQLPPMTVAAFHYVGPDPEQHVDDMASAFVRAVRLGDVKPDSRMFGFNHPNPSETQPVYGYEVWLTIPEDMEVPAPGVKRRVPGGWYAAHTIDFPNFHEWAWLLEWAEHQSDFEPAGSPEGPENMFGCLEEHLNWISTRQGDDSMPIRLDLLLPIRRRQRP